MVSIEQVEKLLEYTDVSYEEARDALTAADGNLLDAIVFLERQGKVPSRGGARNGAVTVLPGNEQERGSYSAPNAENFVESIKRFCKKIGEAFDRFCDYIRAEFSRGGEHREANRAYTSKNTPRSEEPRRDGESEKL